MTDKLKKQLILNLPYLIFVYLFDKLCQGVRLAPGADASEKLLHIGQGFSAAFASLAPSFHLLDLFRRPSPAWRPASICWTCAWAPPARC